MSSNVLVLGNGFDIAIGLKTKYIQFVKSNFWPFNARNCEYSLCLENYILDYIDSQEKTHNYIRWIDIEQLLLDYAIARTKLKDYDSTIVEHDKQSFKKLNQTFDQYLRSEVVPKINRDCLSNLYVKQIIYAISENGTFTEVYSFNFTPTRDILRLFNYDVKVTHLHGCISDTTHPLIIGISDMQEIADEYNFLMKSWAESYESHNLCDALLKAEECVFYGLSFGNADFLYFERFFKEIASRPQATKRKIDIFTLNDASREQIQSTLSKARIPISQLKSYSQFTIHKSDDYRSSDSINPTSFDRFFDFLKHLSPNTENGIVGVDNILYRLSQQNSLIQ